MRVFADQVTNVDMIYLQIYEQVQQLEACFKTTSTSNSSSADWSHSARKKKPPVKNQHNLEQIIGEY